MAAKPCYRIVNWNRFFENAGSRKVSKLAWVAMPNSHDTGGYARVMAHKRGLEIYGAWCLIVQTASKTPDRGVLANDRGPFDAQDLAMRTQLRKPDVFQLAIDFLSSKEIGWLELVADYQSPGSTLPDRPDEVGGGCQVLPNTEPVGPVGPVHPVGQVEQTGGRDLLRTFAGAGPGSDRAGPSSTPSRGSQRVWSQVFAVKVSEAFGLNGTAAKDQQRAFESVGARIHGLIDRNEVTKKVVALAAEKGKANGLNNPVAAWQAEVNRILGEK